MRRAVRHGRRHGARRPRAATSPQKVDLQLREVRQTHHHRQQQPIFVVADQLGVCRPNLVYPRAIVPPTMYSASPSVSFRGGLAARHRFRISPAMSQACVRSGTIGGLMSRP